MKIVSGKLSVYGFHWHGKLAIEELKRRHSGRVEIPILSYTTKKISWWCHPATEQATSPAPYNQLR